MKVNYEFKRGPLTDGELAEIERLAERLRAGQIARKLNRHPSTIGYHMSIRGLRPMRSLNRQTCIRNGRAVKPFDVDEDTFIECLRIQGFTYSKIADLATKRFGHPRNPHTIGIRLKMLAAREEAA
ncbi:MAG TPA: hypothetical protein VEC14_01570 [Reyranellaceae bacterium]|nr:hypothetical protein [Reyranellaceae bacterium]